MEEREAIFFINQLLCNSSDSSDSDTEEIIMPMLISGSEIPKIANYIENVVDKYDDNLFREHFRMFRSTFNFLLASIEDMISTSVVDVGHHTISAKAQLLLTIWYFGTPDSYRSICERFNIGKATGLRTVRRVTNALLTIAPNYIKWPTGHYAEDVVQGFSRMGFPQTIGCIDGSYIPIPLPKEQGRAYICRKNFPCLILQSVCDHRLLFTHCYAGEAGSCHDAKVLKNSEIWRFMAEAPIEKFPNDSHILGDKAYPCTPQLMSPYKDNGHLTPEQIHFNYLLSAARSTIERAFGLLKKRMRCLKFLDVRCMEWIPRYIIACCVIHNICILQNDILELELQDIRNDIEEVEIELGEVALRQLGQQKRDRLCRGLNN